MNSYIIFEIKSVSYWKIMPDFSLLLNGDIISKFLCVKILNSVNIYLVGWLKNYSFCKT